MRINLKSSHGINFDYRIETKKSRKIIFMNLFMFFNDEYNSCCPLSICNNLIIL